MKTERNRRPVWETLLGKSESPLFVVGLDRKILMFNAGCEKLTGWGAPAVVDQICEFHSDASHQTIEALTASLCPPAEILRGEEMDVPTFLECRTGPPLPRLLRFFPLKDNKGKVNAVLGIISEIDPPVAADFSSSMLRYHAELATVRNRLRKRYGEGAFVAKCTAMHRVLNQIELARRSNIHLFLQGEVGSGKEHVARLIHFGGPQQRHWFVPLDCQRMSVTELKSVFERLVEVHRRGIGPDSRPQPGTVYLSDVSALPRDLQEMLVRELLSPPPDKTEGLRVMASGTRSLQESVKEGGLREDLAAALSTLVIELPPLRERAEDLPLLAQHFLEQRNRQSERQVTGFTAEVLEQFLLYHWPGNLDELQGIVSMAGQKAEGGVTLGDLPFRFRAGREAQEYPSPIITPLPLEDILERVERETILQALVRHNYNKSKAAETLQLNRAKLYRRMSQLGIEDREGGELVE